MGGSSWYRNTNKSVKQELDEHFDSGYGSEKHILRSCIKGGAYYAVYKSFSDPNVVLAIATPYETYSEGGWRRIYIKDQDETCGPYQHDFPVKWLDLLTEPVNDYSRDWRERVRAHAEKGKKAILRDGDVIRFKEPLKFTDGREFTELRVYRQGRGGRRVRFSPLQYSYPTYRITRNVFKYREWEVVS